MAYCSCCNGEILYWVGFMKMRSVLVPEDVLNSFVQSVSLDVDHLVWALGLEIGKSSQPPAPSEGKPPLPQPALTTSQARLGSWRSLALACLMRRETS